MSLFPMFIDLSAATVLIVGEGPEADRKAARMAPFCPDICRCPYPPVWDRKPALVILTEKDHPDNEALADHFTALGIPVNVCDRPELCDFRFPALISRGDLSIGIASDGKAPVLTGLMKEQIEASLPDDLEALLDRAADLTARLRKSIPDPRDRARLLREELKRYL